jgi:hypothetical protein
MESNNASSVSEWFSDNSVLWIPDRAFCCADIPYYVGREQKPIEKLMMKLRYRVEIYSVSPDNS